MVNCDNLKLEEPFQGPCFGRAMSKTCQNVTTNKKVSIGLHEMSMKYTQTYIFKVHYMAKEIKERTPNMDKGV